MEHRGHTPEEELLNLIEKGAADKSQRSKKKKSIHSAFFKLFAFLSFGKGMAQAVKKIKKRKIGINIESSNRFLIVVCSLIICFSIFDFILNKEDINIFYERISNTRAKEHREKDIVRLRPFLHYLAVVQRRNIFNPTEPTDDIDKTKEREKALQDFLKDLVLVGISWGKEPQAMIESKKLKQTYFLNVGDVISNLKIEAILKNKVILSYKGQKGELI